MQRTPVRTWQDLLPPIPTPEFKPLTIESFGRVSEEITLQKKIEQDARLKRLGAQIHLAKFEGAM